MAKKATSRRGEHPDYQVKRRKMVPEVVSRREFERRIAEMREQISTLRDDLNHLAKYRWVSPRFGPSPFHPAKPPRSA